MDKTENFQGRYLFVKMFKYFLLRMEMVNYF